MASQVPERTLCGHPYELDWIKTCCIAPLSEQTRRIFEEDKIRELADSIKSTGQIAPILVHFVGPEKYILIGGERRWRACNLTGIEYMDCKVLRGLTPSEFFKLQLHENFHVGVPAKDEARAIKRQYDDAQALGMEFSIPQFAEAIGMSETKVRDALNYANNLNPQIQEAVEQGILPYRIAVRLATIKDQEVQLRLAKDILSNKDGLAKAEEIIRQFKEKDQDEVLFELTIEEMDSNRRILIESGIRWAAKNALAYLQRVSYIYDKGWVSANAIAKSERPLVAAWVELGKRILEIIDGGEVT